MSYVNLFGEDAQQPEQGAGLKGKSLTRDDLKKDYPNTEEDQTWEYDNPGSALRSTQQIHLDWSNFANHTFFHSAEVKVNAAYERMINHFPYDGSLEDKMNFISSLNGWEKYILDIFPKYTGYLNFQSDIFLSIKDSQGYLFPTLSKKNTLKSILGTDSSRNGYTLECFVNPPAGVNTKNQVIFQKLSEDSNSGITVALSASDSGSPTIEVHSYLSSGSDAGVYVLHASASIPRGEFTHIATVYDKEISNTLSLLINGVAVSTSQSSLEINKLDFVQSNILIGSGSSHATGSLPDDDRGAFFAEELLSGSLDELRFWTYPKSHTNISSSIEYAAEETNGLGLYLKFNEPTGSYGSNNIALDSSGNGLHGYITNYDNTNRIIEATKPVKYENSEWNPVLFPDYPALTSKNIALLVTASEYDLANPNYILKLVPPHYLEADLIQPSDPTLLPEYTSSIAAIPGGGSMPSNQIIAHFLFMWAAFFDDLKLYIDTFSDMSSLNYQDIDGIPDHAIQQVAKQYGYELPNMFSDATPEQFHLGRNLNENILYGQKSLKSILNSIWRRVTTEVPHINKNKGTVSSISMLLNSFGIDANSNFRIREYGTSPVKTVATLRKEHKKPLYSIHFNTASLMTMTSSNLVGYRWEPGQPVFSQVARPKYNSSLMTWSQPPVNVALTAGSWSMEAGIKLNKTTTYATQSLMRMDMSQSAAPAGTRTVTTPQRSPFINVLAYSGSSYYPEEFKLRLLMSVSGSDSMLSSSPYAPQYDIDLELPGVNMYEGDRWHIAVTSKMDPTETKAEMSFFATNANASRVYTHKTTSSFYQLGDPSTSHHPLRAYRVTDGGAIADNPDPKPTLAFGPYSDYDNKYLGTGSITDFNGSVNSIRFWSKYLSSTEIKDHAMNPFSVGSDNPIINSPFVRLDNPSLGVTGSHEHPLVNADGHVEINSGSWERLRVIIDPVSNNTSSNAYGNAAILDLSRNGYNMGLFNAASSSQIVSPSFVNYSTLETNWDNPTISNKIRVRSFQDEQTAEEYGAHHGYLARVDPREVPGDDKRFSIEASVAQALNEDISNTISDLFFLHNSIGAPEMLYAVNYPDLDDIADKYFNRLEDKVDFRNYFEFFKWFDTNFTTMVENLMPMTTEFLGVNFVIESHVLERHKLQYQQADVHIDLSRRLAARIETISGCDIVKIT